MLVVARSSMTWDILDMFVVDPGRSWVVAHQGTTREAATIRVARGSTYGILVMSYPEGLPMEFELTAEVRTP